MSFYSYCAAVHINNGGQRLKSPNPKIPASLSSNIWDLCSIASSAQMSTPVVCLYSITKLTKSSEKNKKTGYGLKNVWKENSACSFLTQGLPNMLRVEDYFFTAAYHQGAIKVLVSFQFIHSLE